VISGAKQLDHDFDGIFFSLGAHQRYFIMQNWLWQGKECRQTGHSSPI
jgi:hypothetical protein